MARGTRLDLYRRILSLLLQIVLLFKTLNKLDIFLLRFGGSNATLVELLPGLELVFPL